IDSVQPDTVHLALWLDDVSGTVPLANVRMGQEALGDEPTLAYVSHWFGRDSKSLVYAGSPAKCEEVADKIRQWRESESVEAGPSDSLQEFATLVREHIHRDYYLANMIERGVAFHYGKMPTLLRKAIEHYFANDDGMKVLVCTSTLL